MSDDNKVLLGACLDDVDYFVKRFERRAGGPEGDRFAPPLDRLRLLKERLELLLSAENPERGVHDHQRSGQAQDLMGRAELDQRFNRLNLTLASLLERFAAMPARLEDGLVDMDSSFRSLADRFDGLSTEISHLRAEQEEARRELADLRGFEEGRADRDRILDDHLATLDGRLELLSVGGAAELEPSHRGPVRAQVSEPSSVPSQDDAVLRHLQKFELRQDALEHSLASLVDQVQVIRAFVEGAAEAFGVISQSGRFQRSPGLGRGSALRNRTAALAPEDIPVTGDRQRSAQAKMALSEPAATAAQSAESFLGLTEEEQAALAEIESEIEFEVAAAAALGELEIEDRSLSSEKGIAEKARAERVPEGPNLKSAGPAPEPGARAQQTQGSSLQASDGFRFTIDDLDI
jgi:hypothetical protein